LQSLVVPCDSFYAIRFIACRRRTYRWSQPR
jgi:hypothetical protein